MKWNLSSQFKKLYTLWSQSSQNSPSMFPFCPASLSYREPLYLNKYLILVRATFTRLSFSIVLTATLNIDNNKVRHITCFSGDVNFFHFFGRILSMRNLMLLRFHLCTVKKCIMQFSEKIKEYHWCVCSRQVCTCVRAYGGAWASNYIQSSLGGWQRGGTCEPRL